MAFASEDDELLRRFAGGDADAFVQFYRRHLAAILGFFLRRTGDPELTADLTAEVFAAALLAAERFEPGERPALAWLYGIAAHKLSDSRRRGRVEDRARRRLGLERLEIDDADLERVEALASTEEESGLAEAIGSLPPAPLQNATRVMRQRVLKSAACRRSRPAAVPAVRDGAPSHALLSILGVLRRPATPADSLPPPLRNSAGDAQGVYVRYVRRARVENGISYYVVPASNVLPSGVLPEKCVAALSAALRAELPRIAPALRGPTLRAERRAPATEHEYAEQQATGGVCLMFYGPKANGGTCGATASELSATGLISSTSPLSGVVPDGVASVSVEYPGKAKSTQRTVTVGVVGNVFVTPIFSSSVFGHEQPKMIWRSAGGEIIKTISAGPRDRPTAGFCQSKSRNGC